MTLKADHFTLAGGLNLVTPPLSMRPGELLDCSNVECLLNGGYGRIAGYALYDGQATPSQAVPGSGPVKGVHIYKGEVYAVREDGVNGRLYKATASGWVEITLPAAWSTGGTYRFCSYNFYGQDSQEEMFIVNGVDKPLRYDGTTATAISINAGPHNASNVTGHAGRLVLALESSLLLSKAGDPADFAGTSGAGEIAVGQAINDLFVSFGALIIGCSNATQVLYGTTDADWRLEKLNDSGAFAGTMAQIGGQVISLDQQGIFSLAASQQYGNFAYSAVSQKVQPRFPAMVVAGEDPAATINRYKNQYRCFFGKTGLYATFSGSKLAGIGAVDFAHPVRCISNGEDASGAELTVFGSDDGNVYRMESASSFAGTPIKDFMVLAFNHNGSPTTRKRYRSIVIDAKAIGEAPTIFFRPIIDYGAPGVTITAEQATPTGTSGGALWDYARWDQFHWDSQHYGEMQARLSAVGKNMALIVSSDGTTDGYYEIFGITLHYSPRRLQR